MLCTNCFPDHCVKAVRTQHVLYPLCTRSFIKSEADLAALQLRHAKLQQAKTRFQEDLQRIDLCEATIAQRCEASVAKLVALRDAEIGRLAMVKAELAEAQRMAAEEVECNLFDVNFAPQTSLGAELSQFCQGAHVTLSQFSFTEEPAEPLAPKWVRISYTPRWQPQNSIQRNSAGKNADKKDKSTRCFLTMFTSATVTKFHIPTQSTSSPVRLRETINFSEHSNWTGVSAEEIFMCDAYGQCLLVNCESGNVVRLPPLQTPRILSGLILRQGRVFLLGGCTQASYLQTCEFFVHFPPFQQGSIAAMNYPRESFNPTVYSKQIVVAGGRSSYPQLPVEQYAFERNEFSVLQFSVPAAPTICLFIGEVCIAAQAGAVHRFNTRSRDATSKKAPGTGWSSTRPYILGDYLFTVHNGKATKDPLKRFKT